MISILRQNHETMFASSIFIHYPQRASLHPSSLAAAALQWMSFRFIALFDLFWGSTYTIYMDLLYGVGMVGVCWSQSILTEQ